jgi:hypothetical protein
VLALQHLLHEDATTAGSVLSEVMCYH